MISMRPRRRDLARVDLSQLAWSGADRALAIAAHAAIGFGLLGIGFIMSLVIAGVIWLVSRRRPHVAVHGEQASVYQFAVLIINAIAITAWTTAGFFVLGQRPPITVAMPVAVGQSVSPWLFWLWVLTALLFGLWFVGTIAYGFYGALQVALGREFWYPVVGAWARRKHLSRTDSPPPTTAATSAQQRQSRQSATPSIRGPR